ncbi:sn-glycerol-3-phosphate import ATP-binding protein UgpC [Marinibacterium anthonyi]|nr:sn-glycerol-3-phosphate import ATP-binding protein UgpC [Marinibacterium anthonyi]
MADIRIEGLSKAFGGAEVLKGLDLSIRSQEFLVVLGASGCGKSTLLRLIAGLETPDAGRIRIDGDPVEHLQPGDRGCAMVFQNYALYPHMTVAANMGYGLKVAGMRRKARARRVAEVARLLELDHLLDRRPAQLSGGQRQRVAMGRAMTREPKVFLFDEPLSNLDAKLRTAMRTEIRRLHRQLGTTSVFVTHDQTEAMSMADRMVLMRDGRIEQIGTPQELFRQPDTAFVAGFLGSPAMNLFPARIQPDGSIATEAGWVPAPGLRCDLRSGTDLTMGIRPGALHPTGDETRFVTDLCEDMGTEMHLHLRSSGQPREVVIALAVDRPRPQGAFGLRAAPADVHLFDAATGQRLPARAIPLNTGEPTWQTQPSFT